MKNYFMPAEWDKHEATWLAWPHNKNDWPGRFVPVQWMYGEITRKLAESEKTRIIVYSSAHEKQAVRILSRVGANMENVEFFHFRTDRVWVRDYGPIFVRSENRTAAVDFKFNGWAKYPNHNNDDKIPKRICRKLRMKRIDASDFVLEGGAIDVNGEGTLIATEQCLLDAHVQARNPKFNKKEIEQTLKNHLGVSNILWLGKGIGGDDTHGHVDDVCRFVNKDTVVLCMEENKKDPNNRILRQNMERLERMRLEDGSKINVVPLPMPKAVVFDGIRLPASYANFYIANSVVLVPTFNDPNDRKALDVLADLFPERTVVGIHSVDLVWGLGTIHCITKQQP
ncbi:MAG: agmatine deiminase family protein [Nitrospinae bacterium]|nr:agmatine deiminase family protein [Nitrospinota bacterium]